MKKTIKLFLLMFLFVGFTGYLSSCGKNNNPDDDIVDKPIEEDNDQRKTIYNLAVASGYTGTYEEWLESIKGDYIELSVTNTHIVWRYASESMWRNLIELSKLTGPQGSSGQNGTNGVDGKTPEFRVNEGYLEWKYTTDTVWTKLYEIKTGDSTPVVGTPGEDGVDGLTPYIGQNGNWWIGDVDTNVKAEGVDGTDGKTPEFRVNGGYLEWKYKEEENWKKLYKITNSSISGETEMVTVTLVTEFEFDDRTEEIEIIESQEIVVPKGTIDEPNIKLDGYKITGWYYYDEYDEEYLEWKFKYYYCGSDITLYALSEPAYNVTFVYENGDEISSLEVVQGDYVKLPTVEVAEGYEVYYYINGRKINENFYFYYSSDIVVTVRISEDGDYTYNTYSTSFPTNWNELTYQHSNDADIIDYINSSFFEYDFKFDANGNILPGEFEVEYSAATNLEDVTWNYVGSYNIPLGETKNYAYKITLREDLKWDDGEAITADDFIYSMKEQLNPLFHNYRADSYIDKFAIVGASEYYWSGQDQYFTIDEYLTFPVDGRKAVIDVTPIMSVGLGLTPDKVKGSGYDSYLELADGTYLYDKYEELFSDKCRMEATLENLTEFIADFSSTSFWFAIGMASPTAQEVFDIINKTQALTEEDFAALLDAGSFVTVPKKSPEVKYDDTVGLFKGATDYELIIILDKPIQLLKEDGSLDYKAAYDFVRLPLVQESKYEQYKHAPVEGSTLWTTTYNQSVESTSSWGPYKLTYYEEGKQYILEKNENWYGYNMDKYEGQYQTDMIVCKYIWYHDEIMKEFHKGNIDSVTIDASEAEIYKHSERAIFTPDDFVSSLQLQSDYNALKAREYVGVNKTLLAQPSFRKAISLAINRTEYSNLCTTASKAGYGLFNSMHYYDVANGGVYRNEDVAKQVLCDIYGVDVNKYPSLDEAYNAITGYDLELARQLVNVAVTSAIAAGDYNGYDTVVLTYGVGQISMSVERQYAYVCNALKEMVRGTALEGKLEFELQDRGTNWANDFRAGLYDICLGGWSGAAWDPGYFLLAYLSPDYMYSSGWDTSNTYMEFDADGDGINETLSLLDWYNVLNGYHHMYDWSSLVKAEEERLPLIAALEKEILSVYYTIPLVNSYSASLISYKWDYITTEYNTFMGYGGIRYLTYNYTDYEWKEFCNQNNNYIDYTK